MPCPLEEENMIESPFIAVNQKPDTADLGVKIRAHNSVAISEVSESSRADTI